MNLYTSIIYSIILCFGICATLADIPRPRGVALSKASLYAPGDKFVCLDGKKTIKFEQINDDYCDCADGSDEPGTSACPNGVFHCTNAGHKSKNIPSSRVNDNVCDCCDASDEYKSKAYCYDNCRELGKEEAIREKQQKELIKVGSQLRAELAVKGKAILDEQQNRLTELKKSRSDAELLVKEREVIKDNAVALESAALEKHRIAKEEERAIQNQIAAEENKDEAKAAFDKFDLNLNEKLHFLELQADIIFDTNRDGAVSNEEALFFLDGNDEVDFDTFLTLCWPKIKPYVTLDYGLFKPPNAAERLELGLDPVEGEQTHEDEEEEENYEPESEDDAEEEETGEGEVEEADIPHKEEEYDEDTTVLVQQANGARNFHLEAERQLREIEQEIKNTETLLDRDFGEEEEFAPLNGQCFNFEDREYVYKVCPFDKAVQQAKSGGAETRLGTWDKWIGTENKYSTMYFSNGAACWNGPQRSATVQLECGLETKITSVSEPNRCEYFYVMQTPAACVHSSTANEKATSHDEL